MITKIIIIIAVILIAIALVTATWKTFHDIFVRILKSTLTFILGVIAIVGIVYVLMRIPRSPEVQAGYERLKANNDNAKVTDSLFDNGLQR